MMNLHFAFDFSCIRRRAGEGQKLVNYIANVQATQEKRIYDEFGHWNVKISRI